MKNSAKCKKVNMNGVSGGTGTWTEVGRMSEGSLLEVSTPDTVPVVS